MKTIYLALSEDLHVTGWGTSIENAPSIEIDENHNFFTNFLSYKFINNQLVKGQPPIVEPYVSEVEKQLALLKKAVDDLLLGGL